MKKHIDDKLHQIADPASCFIRSSFDDGVNDDHCTKKPIDDRESTSIFASAHFQCAEELSFDFNRPKRPHDFRRLRAIVDIPSPSYPQIWFTNWRRTPATIFPHSFTVAAEQDQNPTIQETSRGKVQTGYLPTTPTLPSPLSRNRGENLITDPPKRIEALHKLLIQYHGHSYKLEALLDRYAQTSVLPQRSKDFRLDRPKDPDDLLGLSITLGADKTMECYDSESPTNILLGHDLSAVEAHYGISSPFHFRSDPVPSRFPVIVEDPEQTYVLMVGSDTNYNPHFDWSRYLPSAVALDRGSHDRALHDLFRYCTSFCLRLIPDLCLKDMCRVLSVQRSQEPPKTVHYSPMLHNSLVSLALAFSDDPRFRDLKARQYFIDAAKAYMESERQKPTLAVVQALSFLGTFHGSQGDQRLGFMYFGLSARMAQVLGLDVDCSVYVERKLMDHPDTLMIDRNWTAWSIVTSDVCWSLYVGREFATTVPDDDFPLPYIDEKLDEMPVAYGNPTPQPNHTTKTFQSCASLPPDLQLIIKNRSPATPHKLLLHLSFWWLFVLLHRPPFHYRTSMEAGRQIDHVKLCKRAADSVMEILKLYKIPRNNDNQVTILNPGIKEDEYSPSHRGRGRPRQKSPENKRKQSVQWRGGPSGSQLIPQQPPFSLPIPITAASPPKNSNTIPILILTTFRHQSESNVSSFVIEPPDAQTSSTSSSPKVAADILTENSTKKTDN